MRKILLLFLMWIFIWMTAPAVVCSEMQEGTGAYTLGEVVVKAEREGVEAVGTVREITAEDIESKGARTLDEAIELLPGLYMRTGADGVPRVDLRGFRSRHVILLLDGIPINSSFDGNFDPSLIPVESIEKIKVSYGTHSVLYGDGGLGGVINIVTKRGKKGVHGMVSGEAGEGDHYLGSFNFSGVHEKVDFFLSGSVLERNGFRLSDDFDKTPEEDGGIRENSDKRRNNFFANVNFAPSDKVLIGAVFNYLKGEFGKPSTTIFPRDNFSDAQRYERMDNFEGYSGHLSLSYDLPGPFGLRSWIFFNQLTEEENRYDDGNFESITRNGTFHHNNETRIKGAALQTTCDLKTAGFLTLGLKGREEEWEVDGYDITRTGRVDVRDERDINVYTAALEYEVVPLKNLGLVFGYSHNWLEKDEGDDNEGSYLVGAYYDIHENTRIRGSFARKIRFPDIRQLYDVSRGDPDLKTEKSNNYELGIEQKLPLNSKVTLTGFLIDAKDYIEFIETVSTKFINNAKYQFKGAELAAENRYLKNLLLRAGYTYVYTKDKSPGTERDELQYRPKHTVTFESRYSFNFGLLAYMNVMHVADQVFYSRTTPLEKKKLNDYTLFNLKLNQALLKGRVNLYLGADNIFDEDYEESYGFPQAGRFIYGGVTVNL
ncbi:MAG: TonB-dependent receptor [Nitrospirae bacterium]|jgi:vitamin B12 transporter|nr:TonB-dependent receptor [Nitrospirota bacterium]